MNWFKRLCLSEQYRLATLGTLRRRLPDDPWRVRPHAPVTDTQTLFLSLRIRSNHLCAPGTDRSDSPALLRTRSNHIYALQRIQNLTFSRRIQIQFTL